MYSQHGSSEQDSDCGGNIALVDAISDGDVDGLITLVDTLTCSLSANAAAALAAALRACPAISRAALWRSSDWIDEAL